MVEKPVASSLSGGERLATEFEARSLVGAVEHIECCNPTLLSLRPRPASGELGPILQTATRPFRSRIADARGIKDVGTHDIDLTAWLAHSEHATVNAQTTIRSGRQSEEMVAASASPATGVITSHLAN